MIIRYATYAQSGYSAHLVQFHVAQQAVIVATSICIVLSDVIDTFGLDKSGWFCKMAVVISPSVVTGQIGALNHSWSVKSLF
jgi:hypothetical protein